MQHTLSIEYGDELLAGLGLSPAEFSAEASFLLAAKLYELGRVTAGQAAELCKTTRMAFLLSLPRAGVSISNLRPEDADAELAFSREYVELTDDARAELLRRLRAHVADPGAAIPWERAEPSIAGKRSNR